MPKREELIATLGSEPQVVTLTLDELLRRGHHIRDVYVVHTDPTVEPIRRSLARLKSAELAYGSLDPPARFHYVTIAREDGAAVRDICSEADAGAVFGALYRVALDAKRREAGLHLCIAGGRKVMSVYGMSVAQMLFDERDKLWHLLSEGQLFADKRMHSEPGDAVQLVSVPVLRWSSVAPVLTALALTEDPYQALKRGQDLHDEAAARRKQTFLFHELTGAERRLVELLVREPMPNKLLARRLHRSEKTVANQLTAVYRKFRATFGTTRGDRMMLIAELSPMIEPKRERA